MVSCSAVYRLHNIDPEGERSTVITTLPIDITQPLFGTMTRYSEIESSVRLDVGRYTMLEFEITSNTEIKSGSVLLELYIT